MAVVKVLVRPKEVFEKGDVLGQPGRLTECLGYTPVFLSRGIRLWLSVRPCLWLQQVDAVLSRHKVQVTPAQVAAQILIFPFAVQAEDSLAAFPEVCEEKFEQIAFPLAAVAQDKDRAGGHVIRPPVKVHQDVGAEPIPADIEAMGIGLAGIGKGIEVGRTGRRQHPFVFGAEGVVSGRMHREEPFFLP